MNRDVPDYFFDSPLFVFSGYMRRSCVKASNWWISAYSHHPILEMTRGLLYEYWRKENGLEHYNIFHLFFSMACEHYPDEWGRVPTYTNVAPHTLCREIFDAYSDRRYQQISDICVVQKLSNKWELPDSLAGSFYEKLIEIPADRIHETQSDY